MKIEKAIKHTKNALNNEKGIYVVSKNSKQIRNERLIDTFDKMEYLEICLEALEEKFARLENKPLTFEELKDLSGDWVWVKNKLSDFTRPIFVGITEKYEDKNFSVQDINRLYVSVEWDFYKYKLIKE